MSTDESLAEITLINEFWTWFVLNEAALTSGLTDHLVREIDKRMFNLSSSINWEIGPSGFGNSMQFVASPNFDEELTVLCEKIISAAPILKNWFFYPYKPRKILPDFSFSIQLEDGTELAVCANEWRYVLLSYPDGQKEVLFLASPKLSLSEGNNRRWVLGALLLESLLGEDVVMKTNLQWDVLNAWDDRFDKNSKNLAELPTAFEEFYVSVRRD